MSNRHYSVKEHSIPNCSLSPMPGMKETGRVFPTRTRSPNFSLCLTEREVFCLIRRPTQSIRETWSSFLLIRNTPNAPCPTSHLSTMFSGSTGFPFLLPTRPPGRLSVILMMIPVFSIFSARCSRRSATPSTVPRPSARDCWKF